MINYIDRGAISSNGVNGQKAEKNCPSEKKTECFPGSGIQGDFKLTNTENGLIPSAFMVGLLVASPIFAKGASIFCPFRLIGLGLSVWTIAIVGCGFAVNLWTILVCRMFVGVGEASFVNLAAPFINDYAPRGRTTVWLASFYMCIPTGYAFGYIFGGLVPPLFGTWRAAFFVEACFMFPFAVFAFVSRPIPLKGDMKKEKVEVVSKLNGCDPEEGGPSIVDQSHQLESESENKGIQNSFMSSLWSDIRILSKSTPYVVNVAGYTAYTFVLGAYAFWGPKAAKVLFNMEQADTVFGGITVFSGIGGTVFGGFVLDYMGGTVPHAFLFMGAVTFVGSIFCLAAFLSPSMSLFILFLFLGEFFIFAIQGPANVVTLQSVPSPLRPLAIAFCTVVNHLLGDVPSPPILGALQDSFHQWSVSMAIFTAILIPAALFWASGALIRAPEVPPLSSVFHVTSEVIPSESQIKESDSSPLLRDGEDF